MLAAWIYQATIPDSVVIYKIPHWIAGGTNTSYSLVIGKSQLKPFGTIWRETDGPNYISMFPICLDE